ncbi:hypothetical protein M2451_001833 [Dysgonomonas sp. PFB1-18]|uniref:choice-of-anchor J domain-containing protein n=1 Tax=unclassified Dysgonomonas TaxID=2630389 RepID=UPI002473C3BF|nr:MULTISPECIES: choice-of-anchor J domain-containing protein [unclassified Dysgonomonas]MDH6309262.1 hypothetical protein [Dysgonomonas sp. PF1-14]MDH6338858.1 hypothetical protein [Dysgonomonas sp. PF1-16]MDH6380511.1 hypothetical protein [Dysgonomonas sp. PFB1-18]MDH6397686.1 hypothetical protein [Dysgonomonas sp. PF1-23]
MKKIVYILLMVFITFSCKDFNEDNFDWYEDAEKPTNVASYQYTMTEADYGTIVSALNATGTEENKALATKLNAAKKFTPELDPSVLIPYLLEKKYFTADVKSSAMVSYMYDAARDAVLSGLSGAGHVLTMDDYQIAWGDKLYTNSFNPEQTPETNLPKVLKEVFPDAVEGTYKTLEYNYSPDMSEPSIVEGTNYLEETFESYAANATVITDWINKDLTGTKSWQVRSYSGNMYIQMSSNNSGQLNDVWLITKKIDLSEATTPHLLFDVTAGYYNADCLSIQISDNFNGTEAGISTATWKDISAEFTLPKGPTSGFGTLAPAGMGDISDYAGKNSVYIAFHYKGDGMSTPQKSTTFQIDNVKVSDMVIGIDVPNKAPQYATYTYDGSNWKTVGSGILTLQPKDYTEKLSLSSPILSTSQAQTLLPQYMVQNVVGTEKVIVYRTAAGVFYADRLKYENSQWSIQTTLAEESSQFVRAQIDKTKKWIFDPTIIIPISKSDYRMIVDYVKDNLMDGNVDVWDTRGNAEYYFGFSEYYGNITYRELNYRDKDNTYPMSGTTEEKVKFMNDRTIEGLTILLTLKYPDATPMVSGVDQFARYDNIVIYSEPGADTNVTWTYTFQCTGNKEWKFVSRENDKGRIETAQ